MNKNLVTLLLLLTGCCTLIFCADQRDVNLNETALPPIGNIDELEKKTTSTTTSTSSTTTTTTSPIHPNSTSTTTKAPETTTTKTTTTSTTKAPYTTTKTPNTTTVAPITTTPAPGPCPEPNIGTWNSSCIMLKMAAELNFTYITKDNKNATGLYNVPADAKIEDGTCNSNTTQQMQINWGDSEAQSSMTIQFEVKNKTVQMTQLSFILALTPGCFSNAKANQTVQLTHRGFDFSAPAKMSYHCTRSQKLNFTEVIGDHDVIGTVTVHDVQVEAFRSKNSTGFSTVHDCDSAETSDIVPIAVGIALAALIAIVLVAYLCARRRSTLRGYMSF